MRKNNKGDTLAGHRQAAGIWRRGLDSEPLRRRSGRERADGRKPRRRPDLRRAERSEGGFLFRTRGGACQEAVEHRDLAALCMGGAEL